MNINYLAGVPDHRVQEAVIEGIEFLRSRDATRNSFAYDEIVGQVARILLAAQAGEATQAWVQNQIGYQQVPHGIGPEHDDNRRLLGALWQLVAGGVLFPRLIYRHRDGSPLPIDRITLTEKGERLASNAAQHPLHPGFLPRFRQSAPTATPIIVAHLEDAIECLRAGLLRPTLMMVGVANEETIRTTHAAFVHQQFCQAAQPRAGAAMLLGQVLAAVTPWTPGNTHRTPDELRRIRSALSAAEVIRDERNGAAHPGSRITDGAYIESLLMSAGHHLPVRNRSANRVLLRKRSHA
jgi:hypothetical protein